MTATARHFSPRASLAALGLRLRRLRLLEAIAATVHVPQKTVRHTPAEKLYDAFKEDKQGVCINRRRKKRAAAQAMLTLLGTLAHNMLVWAREWLAAADPRLKRYGIVRILRDVLCVSGFVETGECHLM